MATQIARYVHKNNVLPGWNSPQQAWAQTQGQLAWYKSMEEAGELVQISSLEQLNAHLELWETTSEKKPIGYILTLEGADSIVTIDHLQRSYEQGLRAIGPAHYGPGTYAHGTNSIGALCFPCANDYSVLIYVLCNVKALSFPCFKGSALLYGNVTHNKFIGSINSL